MVVITGGHVLEWNEIKEKLDSIKLLQLDQLVQMHNASKNILNDPFKWGDDIELSLIKFDHANKKCHLLLKAEKFFDYINAHKKEIALLEQCEFHNEYTSYMIEGIPFQTYDSSFDAFTKMEQNIGVRKELIQSFLGEDEYVISMTSFPLLGCHNFTWPAFNASNGHGKYESRFFSNKIIMHTDLIRAYTRNKIDRKNALPLIHVPIYKDHNTPVPFVEELAENVAKSDFIYMDHDGFFVYFEIIFNLT